MVAVEATLTLLDCRYEVDAENRVRSVDDGWRAFAEDNAAPELVAGEVLGIPIWSFIAGEGTRRLYGLIFQRVRSTAKPVRVPFRCDSPTERRYMELRIEPRPDGSLVLTGHALRTEPRSPQPLLDPDAHRSTRRVVICGWCKRIQTGPGEWLEVEAAATRLRLLDLDELPQLDHLVCDDCASPWR